MLSISGLFKNFRPILSEGEHAGLGRPVATASVPKNNRLDEETHEVKEIWAALKFTTLATALLLS